MKIAAANSDLKQNRVDYDKKHSTLDRQKWNASYEIREFDQKHSLTKQKMDKD
jgi:hypothetical protein